MRKTCTSLVAASALAVSIAIGPMAQAAETISSAQSENKDIQDFKNQNEIYNNKNP